MAALNAPDTQSASLSLLDTDKPECEGTNKRDFFVLHAHLQRSSEAAKRNLP